MDSSVFDFDKISHLAKAAVADAADKHEVFRTAEFPEFFAMFQDFRGELFADIGKLFELFDGSGVDIYCRFGNY
jgi:hypothetical protein